MSKNAGTVTREGAATAQEVFISVGEALSWWEGSEDMIDMLFTQLCGASEPIAVETFRVAPRSSRSVMIKSALAHYAEHVTDHEISTVLNALKNLEKLSAFRNQIAHGHVSQINETVDDEVTMRGHFLSSTIDPMGMLASRSLNRKYAHTALEIDEWTQKVRNERGKVMDVWAAIVMRDQAIPSSANG